MWATTHPHTSPNKHPGGSGEKKLVSALSVVSRQKLIRISQRSLLCFRVHGKNILCWALLMMLQVSWLPVRSSAVCNPPRNLTFCSPLHLLLFMRAQLWFGLFVFAGVDYRVFVLRVEDEVAVFSRGGRKNKKISRGTVRKTNYKLTIIHLIFFFFPIRRALTSKITKCVLYPSLT